MGNMDRETKQKTPLYSSKKAMIYLKIGIVLLLCELIYSQKQHVVIAQIKFQLFFQNEDIFI